MLQEIVFLLESNGTFIFYISIFNVTNSTVIDVALVNFNILSECPMDRMSGP